MKLHLTETDLNDLHNARNKARGKKIVVDGDALFDLLRDYATLYAQYALVERLTGKVRKSAPEEGLV